MSNRRANGVRIDLSDIEKHKKDVFRLVQLFSPGTSSVPPDSIRSDMVAFCEKTLLEGVPLKQMGIPMTLEESIGLIRRVY